MSGTSDQASGEDAEADREPVTKRASDEEAPEHQGESVGESQDRLRVPRTPPR